MKISLGLIPKARINGYETQNDMLVYLRNLFNAVYFCWILGEMGAKKWVLG